MSLDPDAPDELRDALFAAAPRYHYISTLGYGGMGIVYEALDTELEIHVAIKVLWHVPPAEAEARLARFKREVILSRKVKHPNVAQLYEFGIAGQIPFVTMELVSGQDLGRILSIAHRLDPATVVAILRQIALGTQAAHDGGVVHRDLKPQNVMVDDAGLVAILDFGLAISRADGGDVSGEGVILGTPHYMSPEQAQRGVVGPAADLYAIGAIAFHALTGAPPFQGNGVEVVLQHIGKPPPVARLIEAGSPAALNDIVLRCLAKRPDERFPSARALEHALERLGPLLPIAPRAEEQPAGPPSPTERLEPRPMALVVDDDPDFVRLVTASLAQDGWATLSAPDGGTALQVLDDARVDLVVMDVQMPEVDGFDTTRIIKSQPRWSRLPVLLISAKVDRQRIAFAVQAGATTLLGKPLTPEAIQKAARRFGPAPSQT